MDINLLNVCRNVDNEIVTDDQGNWLVLNPTNNTIECVNPALLNAQSQPSVQPNSQEASSSSSANDKHQYQWERPAILSLIALYKDHYKDFKNTSIKNEKVWRIITEKLGSQGFIYTKVQIENKFKYLKARYIKKKDNEGSKSTGASPVSFEYFQEFDEIFGSNPNVTPTSTASSLRGRSTSVSTDSEAEPPRKKTRMEAQIQTLTETFQQQNNEREQARERRFQARQATLDRAITVYQETMNTFMQKLFEKKE